MTVRLPTPRPAWQRSTGVVIVGSGAAGLSAAVHLAAAGVPTVLLTRAGLADSSTDWAQGGLAAVWDATDSADCHVQDTLVAGAGLCEPAAVRELVDGAPAAIRRLVRLGARFDRDAEGAYDLHLEGGHHARRILHAGGDASGHEVERALSAALRRAIGAPGSSVEVLEHLRAVDVLTDPAGRVRGVRVRQDDGTIGDWSAAAVVLASGGIGQVWPLTTNPTVATGDGIAMAYRAGATVRDMEFTQFHPTVLWIDPARRVPGDRGVLVSEAVRGEGAVIIDQAGRRVMAGLHPLADLAPRDVVSAAMQAHMARTGADHLLLDGRGFGERTWSERFPSILAMCRERGIDPVTTPIPVRPGAHYLCGGVAADLDGHTDVPGLYAVGEVAATGVQGANRLASNSLTEGLVAGDRVGALLATDWRSGTLRPAASRPSGATLPPAAPGLAHQGAGRDRPGSPSLAPLVDPAHRDRLRAVMDRGVEVSRTAAALDGALADLAALPTLETAGRPGGGVLDDAILDMTNLHTVATLVATAAITRTESRGCHRRADHPDPVADWQHHLCLALGTDGAPVVTRQPLADASLPTRTLPLEALA
ncbi:L-aspartate oxidase [Raineyella sp. LH-20]|uniref:L-aspartate oxidase n=1 Tax=Raineyella sp. LH-20 TaxID=3081204 RepID=UPI002952CBDF|nr:FAD-binding protein [Raineyella sp. LH-20]WOP17581.1 FAD-binding protein [Raineyella sp. LH-20]